MEIGTDTKKARNGPKKIHTYVEEKNERKLSLCYTLTWTNRAENSCWWLHMCVWL